MRSADSGDRGLKVCEESRKTQPSRKGTRVSPRAQAGVPRKQEGTSAKGEMQRKRKRTPARGGGRSGAAGAVSGHDRPRRARVLMGHPQLCGRPR